VKYTWTV